MGFFSNLWNGIKNTATNIWNKGKEIVGNVWKPIGGLIRHIPVVGNTIANAAESLGKTINTAGEGIGHLASGRFKEAGKSALKLGVEQLGKKIPLLGGGIADKINEQVDKLKKGGAVRKPSTTSRFQRSD
jgi:hypothetical protein